MTLSPAGPQALAMAFGITGCPRAFGGVLERLSAASAARRCSNQFSSCARRMSCARSWTSP